MPFSFASLVPPWAVIIPSLLCLIGWIEDQPLLLLVGQIQLFAYVTFIRYLIPFFQTWIRARMRTVEERRRRPRGPAVARVVQDATDGKNSIATTEFKDSTMKTCSKTKVQSELELQNETIREWSAAVVTEVDSRSVCSERTATEEIKSSSSQHVVSFANLGSQYRVSPPKPSKSRTPRVSEVTPTCSLASIPGPVRQRRRSNRLSGKPLTSFASLASILSIRSANSAETDITGTAASDDDAASDATERCPEGHGWEESSGELLAYGTT